VAEAVATAAVFVPLMLLGVYIQKRQGARIRKPTTWRDWLSIVALFLVFWLVMRWWSAEHDRCLAQHPGYELEECSPANEGTTPD
jgi:hypothetical protein